MEDRAIIPRTTREGRFFLPLTDSTRFYSTADTPTDAVVRAHWKVEPTTRDWACSDAEDVRVTLAMEGAVPTEARPDLVFRAIQETMRRAYPTRIPAKGWPASVTVEWEG